MFALGCSALWRRCLPWVSRPYHQGRIPDLALAPNTSAVSPDAPGRLNVLLVDDDESLRLALARAIRLAGFDVEMFASAETLLARDVCDRDACLVLDVDLPGMDGIECMRTLDAFGRNLPTVFITALPPAEVNEALAALEPIGVLYKPFNKRDLIAASGRACA